LKTRDAIKRFKELAAEYDEIMSKFPNGFNSFDEPEAFAKTNAIRKEMESFVYDARFTHVDYSGDGNPKHYNVVRPALRDLTRGWEF
jgi:hypothetical protein